MNMYLKRIVAAAAMFFAIAGCGSREIEFDACGQIDATDVTVSAESGGMILSLDIEEGDRLVEGQRLGAIDSAQIWLQRQELQKRKEGALARLVDIDRQLAPSIAQLESLRKDHERFASLLSKDAGTRKQLDDNESQIAVLEGQIAAQKQTYAQQNDATMAEIGTYEVQMAQRDDQLKKCRITAPVSGKVLAKYAEAGESVTSGKPLFRMADMDRVYVRAYFSTSQLASLAVGDKVTVIPDDGTDSPKEYEGTVTWISDEAEFTPKNIQTRDERADLVYAVKVSLKNDGNLRLGMYAYVRK